MVNQPSLLRRLADAFAPPAPAAPPASEPSLLPALLPPPAVMPNPAIPPHLLPLPMAWQRAAPLQAEPQGSYGTDVFHGYINEEYLSKLLGVARAKALDEIRLGDYQASACLDAVRNPILGASWKVEPGEQGVPDYQRHAEFIEHVLFKDMELSWLQFITEALTHVDFGFSVHERVDKAVIGHPKWGNYIGLRGLFWRSPKTIEQWNVDPVSGKLLGVRQLANGDLQRNAWIDSQFLLVYSRKREGANYEGVSALRPCYGPWFRKQILLKLGTIGAERFAIPTPSVAVPPGAEGTADFSRMKTVLQRWLSHERSSLMYPKEWELELLSGNFDPEKLDKVVDSEDKRMVKAFLVNFLELGLNGTGTQALSRDLSDFFLEGVEYVAEIICEGLNRNIIPGLIDRNFGPQACYPTLSASGISDRAGKEFGELISGLGSAGFLTADDPLEENLRDRIGLPKSDPLTRRKAPAPSGFGGGFGGAPAGPPGAPPMGLAERFRRRRATLG